jgi:hypothetical protein
LERFELGVGLADGCIQVVILVGATCLVKAADNFGEDARGLHDLLTHRSNRELLPLLQLEQSWLQQSPHLLDALDKRF